ncbi:MAG: F0F1 ATP synthase subunit delta [Candidatus Dormibacteraceae bacterium]
MASASARRYARAIFELALAEGSEAVWARRLEILDRLLSEPRVRAVVENPSLATSRRLEAIAAVIPKEAGAEGLNLARMLVTGRRSAVIGEIESEFQRLVDEASGRVRATATTAVELARRDREHLTRELSKRLGKKVRLEVRVDPAIVGGLVLQIGDRVVDASIASRLRQLHRQLAGT